VQQFMHWPETETFSSVLADAGERTPPDDRGWINLAVLSRRSGRLVADHGLIVRAGCPCIGLALLPEMRRQGLGRELVEGSCAWLAAAGYTAIEAEIDYGNSASFALFAALGFTMIDDRTDTAGPYAVLRRGLTAAS
jgi:RimJ/RimL family protein N-acetyltransferase